MGSPKENNLTLFTETFGTFDICDENVRTFEASMEAKFLRKLETNPNFLFAWMNETYGGKVINADSVANLIRELSRVIQRPKTKAQMQRLPYNVGSSYEVIVLFFVEAYVIAHLRRRNLVKASRLIEQGLFYATSLVGQGMDPEYLPGVNYLHRWSQLYVSILQGKLPFVSPQTYDGPTEFSSLPPKSQAIVLCAKLSLETYDRRSGKLPVDQLLQTLRKIVALDPFCYEWHYLLGTWLRTERRKIFPKPYPSEEEEQILWETFNNCDHANMKDTSLGTRLKNRAFAAVLQGISDVLYCRKWTKNEGIPLKFGDLNFSNCADASRFIVKEAERVPNNKDATFGELIRAGEMMCNLPVVYRNYQLAETCYLKALNTTHARSTKLHHKLGLLYATSTLQNFPKSLKHLQTSWKEEPANIPSGIDLVNVLMRDIRHNLEEINQTIQSLLNININAGVHSRHHLFFLLGCLKFAKGQNQEAVELWIKAQTINTEVLIIHLLISSAKRFQWDPRTFSFERIRNVIEEYKRLHCSSLSPADFETLQCLLRSCPNVSPRNIPYPGQSHSRQPPRGLASSSSSRNWREN